jgi:hypothetical protein
LEWNQEGETRREGDEETESQDRNQVASLPLLLPLSPSPTLPLVFLNPEP